MVHEITARHYFPRKISSFIRESSFDCPQDKTRPDASVLEYNFDIIDY